MRMLSEAAPSEAKGSTVAEIHAYPALPEGFAEPLFPTPQSKREQMEHLLQAPWLKRAAELVAVSGITSSGRAAHRLEEQVELRRVPRVKDIAVVRERSPGCRGRLQKRRNWRRRKIVCVLERWREVGGWWDAGKSVNRTVFRVELSDGGVVDLACQQGPQDSSLGRGCEEHQEGSDNVTWWLVGLVD